MESVATLEDVTPTDVSHQDLARRLADAIARLGDDGAMRRGVIARILADIPTAAHVRLLEHHCVARPGDDARVVVVVLERREPPAVPPAEVARRFHLTRRETEVAMLLAERRTNSEISTALGISRHTVKRHAEQVLAKLGVRSRSRVSDLVRELPVYLPNSSPSLDL